jgi:hypothetical protein
MADQAGEKIKGVADIVFLIDVTGSMQPCIDALKTNIGVFIDTLTTKGPNNDSPVKDWRAKVVGFRDFTGDSEPFIDNAFVRDGSALKSQLSSLTADGGGDEPESLLDALYKVANMGQTDKGASESDRKWRYTSGATRVVVAFTDASYRETMSIPEATGGTVADVQNACHTNKIVLSLFAPDLPCYNPLAEIQRSEWVAVRGENPQQALAAYTSDQANFVATLKQLAKTVSKSCAEPVA